MIGIAFIALYDMFYICICRRGNDIMRPKGRVRISGNSAILQGMKC
jgi:hypothetical protein